MNHRCLTYLFIIPLLATLFVACDKEEDIYGILYADMVTAHTPKDKEAYFTYQPNDASVVDTLYPQPALSPGEVKDGVRMLLQYRPIEQLAEHRQRIEVQVLSAIHFDTLKAVSQEFLDKFPNDTLYLQSVWKTGDFLNVRYRVEYNNSPHSILLLTDKSELSSGDTLKLQLRHSRNDDPVGHWRSTYSSFNISAYRNHPYTTIELYVNQVNFNYKYYYFNLD